jgi:N-methylhydantoinase B
MKTGIKETNSNKFGLDGVQIALLANRMQNIVRKMANTLGRTGRSGVLNTALDFSCAIITNENELLVVGDSLPIHVMNGPNLTSKWLKLFHPDLRRGDAFYHNSPYHGNSHAADHCVMAPVIDEEGNHHFTVFVKAHQADTGNSLPTTYNAAARDVYEEGALIFPVIKVQENYQDIDDIIRICKMRIRVPEQWWGDYLAMLGAVRIGERELLALGAEIGWDNLHSFAWEWLNYSEQCMIAAIKALPSGRATVSGAHDPFLGLNEGIPFRVTVEIDSEEAIFEVDLRDGPDCVSYGLNLTEATASSGAMIGVYNSVKNTVPKNAGSQRRIHIRLRENCAIGIPQHPVSCSAATTNLSDRVINSVQRALSEISDGIGQAEGGLYNGPYAGVISGRDPRIGNAPFMNQLHLAFTGGAATPTTDGWLTALHSGSAGMLMKDSVEIDELLYPLLVKEIRLLKDTEGVGRRRSAPSLRVEYEPIDTEMGVMFNSDGTIFPARGARGGGDGHCAEQYIRDKSGQLCKVDSYGRVILKPGESIIGVCSSGGGYGHPHERESERVRQDVIEGWISNIQAKEVYGVIIDDTNTIDFIATQELRNRMSIDKRRTDSFSSI